MRVFQAMLVLRDVSKSLGKDPLLNRASIDFSPDAPTAVLGLQAPGRDAFLRLLSGVDKPQAGSVRLAGEDVTRLRREKGRIIRIGPNGVKPSGQRVRKLIAEETVARAGLADVSGAIVSDLDLEQRVRLAMAMAVEERPGLILLDSPASELELQSRERFVTDLGPMFAGLNPMVVVLVGAADEALGLAGQAVVLAAGQAVQVGPVAEVMTRPANLAAARVVAPVLNTVAMVAREGAGVLADGAVFQPPEGVVLPVAGACTLAFHPDDVTLERKDAACVRFVVRAAGGTKEGVAGKRYARVAFAGATWLTPEPAVAVAPGMMLNAFVDRSRLMVFDAEGKAVG
jgi:ABC-type sulfate/molybdate transport systems ATPase subunit